MVALIRAMHERGATVCSACSGTPTRRPVSSTGRSDDPLVVRGLLPRARPQVGAAPRRGARSLGRRWSARDWAPRPPGTTSPFTWSRATSDPPRPRPWRASTFSSGTEAARPRSRSSIREPITGTRSCSAPNAGSRNNYAIAAPVAEMVWRSRLSAHLPAPSEPAARSPVQIPMARSRLPRPASVADQKSGRSAGHAPGPPAATAVPPCGDEAPVLVHPRPLELA